MKSFKDKFRTVFGFAGLCLVSVFFHGCGPSLRFIEVNTLKPAAVSLKGIKKIAVMRFDGAEGDGVAKRFAARLAGAGLYDIIGPDKVSKALMGHDLKAAGLMDGEKAALIGRLTGAEAVISGTVDEYRVADEKGFLSLPKVRDRDYYLELNGDKKPKRVKVTGQEWYSVNAQYKVRRVNVSVTIKVTRAEGGEIMTYKNVSRSWEGMNIADPDSRHRDAYPTPKQRSAVLSDGPSVLKRLLDEVIPQLAGHIAPYHVKEKMPWLVIDEKTETAGRFIDRGEYGEALGTLKSDLVDIEAGPVDKDKLHPVYYDMGVVNGIMGEFDPAEVFYRKAIDIKGDEIYIDALASLKKAREENMRLKGE